MRGIATTANTPTSISGLFDRDPGARASFGIYGAETRKTVHVRDVF